MAKFKLKDLYHDGGGPVVSAFNLRPFPGPNPLRLFIRVSIRRSRPTQGGKVKWVTRYRYWGKWNYGAMKKAERLYTALGAQDKTATIAEVLPNGYLSRQTWTMRAGEEAKYTYVSPMRSAIMIDPWKVVPRNVIASRIMFDKPPVLLRLSKKVSVFWCGTDPDVTPEQSFPDWDAVKKFCRVRYKTIAEGRHV